MCWRLPIASDLCCGRHLATSTSTVSCLLRFFFIWSTQPWCFTPVPQFFYSPSSVALPLPLPNSRQWFHLFYFFFLWLLRLSISVCLSWIPELTAPQAALQFEWSTNSSAKVGSKPEQTLFITFNTVSQGPWVVDILLGAVSFAVLLCSCHCITLCMYPNPTLMTQTYLKPPFEQKCMVFKFW